MIWVPCSWASWSCNSNLLTSSSWVYCWSWRAAIEGVRLAASFRPERGAVCLWKVAAANSNENLAYKAIWLTAWRREHDNHWAIPCYWLTSTWEHFLVFSSFLFLNYLKIWGCPFSSEADIQRPWTKKKIQNINDLKCKIKIKKHMV